MPRERALLMRLRWLLMATLLLALFLSVYSGLAHLA